jgi:hypothetical protein
MEGNRLTRDMQIVITQHHPEPSPLTLSRHPDTIKTRLRPWRITFTGSDWTLQSRFNPITGGRCVFRRRPDTHSDFGRTLIPESPDTCSGASGHPEKGAWRRWITKAMMRPQKGGADGEGEVIHVKCPTNCPMRPRRARPGVLQELQATTCHRAENDYPEHGIDQTRCRPLMAARAR